jgi:hypothetical protein
METIPENETQTTTPPIERLAYSVQEAADMLGVQLFQHVSADSARQIQNLPCAAGQIARATNRTVKTSANRFEVNYELLRKTHTASRTG